jgi:hypothetical protein
METVTLVFNAQMINTIMEALGNAPFKVASPVIQAINIQIQEQIKPKAPVAVPDLKEVK